MDLDLYRGCTILMKMTYMVFTQLITQVLAELTIRIQTGITHVYQLTLPLVKQVIKLDNLLHQGKCQLVNVGNASLYTDR